MAKISKCLLWALSITNEVHGDNYYTTGCMTTDGTRPELSYKIQKDHFETLFPGQEGDYELNGDFYERSIPEADLTLAWDDDNDVISLSYTLTPTITGFDLTNSASISFGDESIKFQCNYARTVTTDAIIVVPTAQPQPVIGNGQLTYNIEVTVGDLGGTSAVRITPNHGFGSQITARLTECKITDSSDTHEVYAIHSFGDDVCFDNSRLKVVQTEFGSIVGFDMRTFRFITNQAVTNAQNQTLSCTLHLDPAEEPIDQSQARNCDCYTQDECTRPNSYQAALILGRTYYPPFSQHSLLVTPEGNYNQIDFQLGQNTFVSGACAATLNNERYIFGGNGDGNYQDGGTGAHVERQLSKIEGCSLNRIGSIPFNFKMGTCETFNFDGVEMVLLCFDLNETSACRTYDGTNFAESTNSNYFHSQSRLGSYLQRPFVVGGQLGQSLNSKTEIMNMETGNYEWEIAPDFPESRFTNYEPVSTSNAVYLIGGISRTENNPIHKFQNMEWSLYIGNLQQAKYNTAAIHIGNNFLIMGGARNFEPTEIWNLETGSGEIVNQATIGVSNPIAFGVDLDFCAQS